MKLTDFIPPVYYKLLFKLGIKKRNNFRQSYDGGLVNSYSQYGEDLIIDAIFHNKEKGFYIDIGANDPYKLNNTYRFYKKGWTGINIEPNPILLNAFREHRIKDVNLNIGIGQKFEELTFYEFSLAVHSTFNKQIARQIESSSKLKVVKEYQIPVWSLNKLYEEVVTTKKVDFMSIDTEGFEREILLGNNWEKNRPSLIVIEIGQNGEWIYKFLISKAYEPICFNHVNAFFMDKQI